MPTIVTCHNCGQRFQAEDFLAGKQVSCPKCGNPLQIPVLDAVSDFAPPGSLPTPAIAPRTARISPQTQQRGSGVNQRLVVVACAIGGGAVVLLFLAVLIGSLFSSNGESSPDATAGPPVERPSGLLVYQPALIWANEEVLFKPPFELQSQSGSPLISQSTGKVIGTLAGGGPARGGIAILIAPSRTILDAMNRATAPLPLQTVVGR